MEKKITIAELTTTESPTWCAGCGDFSILSTIKSAFAEAGVEQKNTLIVSGIGCGSKLPHFVRTYGFEGLHGRAIPVATGAKLANNNLCVVVTVGDGDGYGIGGNHFLHVLRRNLDITMIVQNNAVYGLTKGQTSPTSQKGFSSPSTPSGALEEAVNPMALAIAGGATYVARGYSFDINHLKMLITNGIKHKGFSLIDVFQPCTTYNRVNTMQWYKERIYRLEDESHDPFDKAKAMQKAEEWGERIPIGLFYKASRPTYDEGVKQIQETPLAMQDIGNVDISPMMQRFK